MAVHLFYPMASTGRTPSRLTVVMSLKKDKERNKQVRQATDMC